MTGGFIRRERMGMQRRSSRRRRADAGERGDRRRMFNGWRVGAYFVVRERQNGVADAVLEQLEIVGAQSFSPPCRSGRGRRRRRGRG
jgi:hypothetical protein